MTPWHWIGLITLAVVLINVAVVRALRRQLPATPLIKLAPICGNCEHFDLEEGQAVMRRHPPFMQAAAVLQPQQMGRQLLRYDKHACDVCGASADPDNPGDFKPTDKTPDCHVCRGDGSVDQPVYEQSTLPAKAAWSEFGACGLHHTVLWRGDSCGDFVQLRSK